MKFYVVKRDTENVDYDEYNSVVVYAHSKKEALEIAIKFKPYFAEKETTVEFVRKDKRPRIVHTSFCAG